MNNITLQSLDVVDHIINDELEKVAEIASNLSEEASAAYIPTYEEQQARDESDFALVLWNPRSGHMRKFAMYTPELVELNMALLATKLGELPEEIVKIAAANLTSAAFNYNLDIPEVLAPFKSEEFIDNIVDTRQVQPVLEKTASISKFAWVKEEKFPLETEMDVKQAAAYFEQHHYKMPLEKKAEFIVNTMKASEEMDVALNSTAIQKYANLNRAEFNPEFFDHIQIRKTYLKDNDEELHGLYDDLARKADALGPQKVAMVLAKLDEKACVLGSYGKGIEDPFLATFNVEKIAGRLIDGIQVTQKQLSDIPSAELSPIVGERHIAALKGEEGLDVLETLPTPFRRGVLDLL